MAEYNGYQGQQQFSPTEYGFGFSNSESKIDKTNLSFSMWKTTLQIRISPLVETGNSEFKIDRKNSVTAFLVPAKVHMFSDILKKFKEDPKKYDNYGVASGKALISVMNAKSFGDKEDKAVINIRTIGESGTVESSYSYEVRTNVYNAVTGFDEKNGSFKQDFDMYRDVELDMIITQLDEYVKAMTNTIAFTVANSTYKYFDKLATKIGVDLNSYGNYSRSTNQSYFNPANSDGHMFNNGGQQQQNQQQAPSNPSVVQGGLNALIGN